MKIILLIILFFIGCHPPKKFIYKYKSSPKNWFRFNMGEKYGPKIGKLSNNTFWIDSLESNWNGLDSLEIIITDLLGLSDTIIFNIFAHQVIDKPKFL